MAFFTSEGFAVMSLIRTTLNVPLCTNIKVVINTGHYVFPIVFDRSKRAFYVGRSQSFALCPECAHFEKNFAKSTAFSRGCPQSLQTNAEIVDCI